MVTLDKIQGVNYFLMDLLSEKYRLGQAAKAFSTKWGEKINHEWEALTGLAQEETGFYDDWMEYRGIQMSLADLEQRIAEIKNGNFSFA